MSTRYRAEYNDKDMFADIFLHLLRWLLLTLVTGGIALALYPFYFVRFLSERVTVIREKD